MLALSLTQALVAALYLFLAGAVVYARPPLPRRGRRTSEPRSRRRGETLVEAVWLATLAAALLYPLGIFVAPAALESAPLAVSFAGDAPVQLVGVASVLAGGALLGWAFRSLGRFATLEMRVGPDHRVVREGPYTRLRHPMYTANLLWSAGFALTLLSPPLAAAAVLVLTLAVYRAREEERLFLASAHLQREYARYLGTTGRFLPRIAVRRRRTGHGEDE